MTDIERITYFYKHMNHYAPDEIIACPITNLINCKTCKIHLNHIGCKLKTNDQNGHPKSLQNFIITTLIEIKKYNELP